LVVTCGNGHILPHRDSHRGHLIDVSLIDGHLIVVSLIGSHFIGVLLTEVIP
jgi:hypothetical protein